MKYDKLCLYEFTILSLNISIQKFMGGNTSVKNVNSNIRCEKQWGLHVLVQLSAWTVDTTVKFCFKLSEWIFIFVSLL